MYGIYRAIAQRHRDVLDDRYESIISIEFRKLVCMNEVDRSLRTPRGEVTSSPRATRRSSKVQLPVYGGHGIRVDADGVRRAERRMWRAAADRGLAARHDAVLAAALPALHLVPPHSAPTLSNSILTPYKHLICNKRTLPRSKDRKLRVKF